MRKHFIVAIQILLSTNAFGQLRPYSEKDLPVDFQDAEKFYQQANKKLSKKDFQTFPALINKGFFDCNIHKDLVKCDLENNSVYGYDESDDVTQKMFAKNENIFDENFCKFYVAPEFAEDRRFNGGGTFAAPSYITPQQFQLMHQQSTLRTSSFTPTNSQQVALSQGMLFVGLWKPSIPELLEYGSFYKNDFSSDSKEASITVGFNNKNVYSDIGSEFKFSYRKVNGLLIKKLALSDPLNSQIVGFAVCQQHPKTKYFCYTSAVTKVALFEGKNIYRTGNILVEGKSAKEAQNLMKERLDEIISPVWEDYFKRIGNTFSFKEHQILHRSLEKSVRCSKDIQKLDLQIIVSPNTVGKPFSFPISKLRAW